jgi:hypothetical protein
MLVVTFNVARPFVNTILVNLTKTVLISPFILIPFFFIGFQPPLISTPQPGQIIDNLAPITPIESFFSGKHNGIYIYLGRIIRPIWIRELISEKKMGNSLLVRYYIIFFLMFVELIPKLIFTIRKRGVQVNT